MNRFITPSINYSLRQLTIGKILSIFQLLHWTSDIIWVSCVMRKPVYAICEQQRRRSACASEDMLLVTRLISSHLLSDPALWRSSGHHRWRCNNSEWGFPPFRLLLPSESHQTPFPCYLPISSSVFLSFLFLFSVPCRIVFAMPEDLEMWRYHPSFRF